MKFISKLFFFAFLSTTAFAGDRIYVSDNNDIYGELKIESAKKASSANYVKDPSRKASPPEKAEKISRTLPKSVKFKPEPAAPKKLSYKPNRLQFRAMRVDGRLSRPRVDFARELLPRERFDEPVDIGFYEKIFEKHSEGDL